MCIWADLFTAAKGLTNGIIPMGAVFASRTPRWTLAVVARRGALASLMLYDLRAVLGDTVLEVRRLSLADDTPFSVSIGLAGQAGQFVRLERVAQILAHLFGLVFHVDGLAQLRGGDAAKAALRRNFDDHGKDPPQMGGI